jgi:hypothetical protein
MSDPGSQDELEVGEVPRLAASRWPSHKVVEAVGNSKMRPPAQCRAEAVSARFEAAQGRSLFSESPDRQRPAWPHHQCRS